MLGELAKTALVRLDFPTAFTLGLQLSLELLDTRSRGFQRGGLRVVELFGLTIGHGVISVGSDKTRRAGNSIGRFVLSKQAEYIKKISARLGRNVVWKNGGAVPFVIHIVDDDPAIRESLKGLLSDAGFNVDCYSSAEAFLNVRAPRRGCALIDLRLKDMDGLTLQKELIATNAAVSVIMMSAYGDIEHAVAAMRLGAVDFVEKPFSPEMMLKRIQQLSKSTDADDLALREARQHAALIELLTPREKQVMSMIVDGLANKQVAGQLGISARTVETHRVHIMQKLNAESLPHLVRIWLSAGHLVEVPEA